MIFAYKTECHTHESDIWQMKVIYDKKILIKDEKKNSVNNVCIISDDINWDSTPTHDSTLIDKTHLHESAMHIFKFKNIL